MVLAACVAHAGLEAKLERLMAAKGSSFEKEVAYRASQAAGEGPGGCNTLVMPSQTHSNTAVYRTPMTWDQTYSGISLQTAASEFASLSKATHAPHMT